MEEELPFSFIASDKSALLYDWRSSDVGDFKFVFGGPPIGHPYLTGEEGAQEWDLGGAE